MFNSTKMIFQQFSCDTLFNWDLNFAQKMRDLLHWDAELHSVRRLLFSRPHQSHEPFRSEDSKLWVAQLVERVTGMRLTGVTDTVTSQITEKSQEPQNKIKHHVVTYCFPYHHCLKSTKATVEWMNLRAKVIHIDIDSALRCNWRYILRYSSKQSNNSEAISNYNI